METFIPFLAEKEKQFSKKQYGLSFLCETVKLHTLFSVIENVNYKEELTAVATREELKNAGNDAKFILTQLYQKLEELIPSLKGVLINHTFHELDDNELYKLVVLFERYGLTVEQYQEKELTVAFFNHLLKEYSQDAKGIETTPEGLSQLMVQLVKPENGTVYDGTAGFANVLVEAHAKGKNVTVFGQEINVEYALLGKLNLLINEILPNEGDLKLGDTLKDPQWLENNRLQTFDYVLMNTPFSNRDWGYEFALNDPFGRFDLYDIPSKAYGEYAFILHALASLKNSGKAVVMVPFGTLVRGATERKIRSILVKDDCIETIISLPSNLFIGYGTQVALLVLNKNKSVERKGKIQFINAEGDYDRIRSQKWLNEEHIKKIVNSYNHFENMESYSRLVTVNEIEDNQFDLNPSLYFVNRQLDTTIGNILFNRKKYETEVKNLVSLNKIAEIIRGVNLPSKRIVETKGDESYPLIQIRDVENGEIQFDTIDSFPVQTRDIDRVTAKPGDILVSSRGTQQKIAVVPEYNGQVLVSSMFIIIRLTSEEVNPFYVKRILESPVGQYFIEVNQSGSVVTVLTPRDIEIIEIPLLPLPQQNQLVNELQEADDLIKKAQEERKNRYYQAYGAIGFQNVIRKN